MSKLSMVAELFGLMRHNKKWWLFPIITILVGFGVLMVFAGGSALAPFIYSIF